MKHLIITIASILAFAASAGSPMGEPTTNAVNCTVKTVCGSKGKVTRAQWKSMTPEERTAAKKAAKAENASGREKSEAKRYGYSLEDWCSMPKKDRKEVRQKAKAKEMGMTVEEMKAWANRKEADKVGCPADKWAAMTVKDRIAYRKQVKAAAVEITAE